TAAAISQTKNSSSSSATSSAASLRESADTSESPLAPEGERKSSMARSGNSNCLVTDCRGNFSDQNSSSSSATSSAASLRESADTSESPLAPEGERNRQWALSCPPTAEVSPVEMCLRSKLPRQFLRPELSSSSATSSAASLRESADTSESPLAPEGERNRQWALSCPQPLKSARSRCAFDPNGPERKFKLFGDRSTCVTDLPV
uniref:Zinc finger, C3HC4 type (RING finger) domain-containing protein n=1 Tax=Macrostomum lignano TaxID=282301 RepID=A0A1I8J0I7_9PLAT